MQKTVREWSVAHADVGLLGDRLVDTVGVAVRNALDGTKPTPYGCFVSPRGGVA